MEYAKSLKHRDKLEMELKGIQWKVDNATKIKIQMQSWYYKKLDEYKKFLIENNLTAININIVPDPEPARLA